MGFLTFVGGIVILILVLNLRGRVQRLEQTVRGEAPPLASPTPEPNYPSPQFETQHAKTSQNTVVAQGEKESRPTASDKFILWIKEDWLLKLGAMLLLIGFGWLATYAFLNNWIGPMGRIALGIVAGALFMALGWWRVRTYIHQGGIFLVLGSTTILLTIFAAREIYDFFTPLSALAVMFLSTAFVAFVSVVYNSRALALASLILAGTAPLLTNAPSPDYIGLFSYLFVVLLGAIWITVLTGRRELTTAALIIVALYSLPHLSFFTLADKGVLLLFAYAFAAVFFVTNTAGILKLKGKAIVPDLVTAAGNGLLLLAWIMTAAQDEWKSLIIATWMIVFAVGAFLIFRITERHEPFYVYAGVGIAMLAAATSAELDGAALTIAYTIESGIIAFITYIILRDIKITERISLLLVGPVLLSVGSLTSRAWNTGVLHEHFFVLFVLALMLLWLGHFFLKHTNESQGKEPNYLSATLLITGSFYVYALLWLSLHGGLQNDNTAVMLSLVIYTIIGLIAYFYGRAHEDRGLKLYGGVLIGFVVGRLLLVDIWQMELTGRIGTFFLIGTLLVSTAFLGRKKKNTTPPEHTL